MADPAPQSIPEPRGTERGTAATTDDVRRARDAARQATLMVADTIGELMEFWNFKPSMGRVWAVLYLSRTPLSAAEIAERTGLSSGSVSMTIQDLLKWGVIRRAWAPSERRRLWEAETDVVAMVTRVFRERELRLITDAIERLEAARRLLDDEARSSSPDQMLEGRFLATRVDAMLRLARAGRRVVEQLARAGSVDLGAVRDALRRR
ncbi:MAG: MarR family transcriptional regulator [Deltaproteobacteria bacterium]|nr:MAG: MarR family transcriptional regulator [Deltaproteobacteria bacterium]